MAKFRIHLKVQALELDIDGERADIPAISNAVSRQLSGLIQPAAALTSGAEPPSNNGVIDADTDTGKATKRPSRKRGAGAKTAAEGAPGQALDFRHEPEKYGNPQQAWSVLEKSLWMLAVIKGILGQKEVSGPQIAATYNDKFKQAGKLHPPNVTRDLGNAKVQNPPPVGQDKDLWYLTNEGDRQAQQLIQGVITPAS